MSKKDITAEKIKGVQAKFSTAFLSQGSDPSGSVEDASKEPLSNCYSSMRETANEIGETVSSFNKYLDSVAEAFKNTDTDLASQIKNSQLVENNATHSRKKMRESLARQNGYYTEI